MSGLYGVPTSDMPSPGAAGASDAALSLEDIEKNELALKAEVYSRLDRAGEEAAGQPKASGITADNLFVQLRNLGHDVTREFVADIFAEITKSSGQTAIELPDFLKFLDDPTYAPEADDEPLNANGANGANGTGANGTANGTNTTPTGSAGAAAAAAGDSKYGGAPSPKAADGKGGDAKGPDSAAAAAVAEQRKKELMERRLNAPMTADALEGAYRVLQSAHPQADGLTVGDFEAAYRMARENADSHKGVLNAVKQPTPQELQELMKSIDPYSPDVILRDALARWVLINDHVTVAQPLFLTAPAGAAAGVAGGVAPGGPGTPGAMMLSPQMSTASLAAVGVGAGGAAPQGVGMGVMSMAGAGMAMPMPMAMGLGPAGGAPIMRQLSSSGSAASLGMRKSTMLQG